MAKIKPSVVTSIKCETCGKSILPTVASVPTDYVYYNGHNVCMECLKAGKTKELKEGGLK